MPSQPNKKENQIIELKKKLNELENKVDTLSVRVEELESYKIVSARVNDLLSKQLDSLDQYSRRSNIIMRNVWLPENETNDQLEKKIKKIISEDMKLPDATKDIDKLHRVGKVKEFNNKKQQNVIVRFKTHATRYAVYREKKKLRNIKISANLTKARGKLLHEALDLVSDNNNVDFVLSDIHGDLRVKLKNDHNGKNFFKFNSLENLNEMLVDMEINETEWKLNKNTRSER